MAKDMNIDIQYVLIELIEKEMEGKPELDTHDENCTAGR